MFLILLVKAVITAVTSFFSYWHGRGDGPDLIKEWYETKGLLIAGEALVGAIAGYILTDYNLIGLAGCLISPYYWFLWRTSREARAALDYMGRLTRGKLIKVLQAYYLPAGVNAALMLCASSYIAYATGDWSNFLFIPFDLATVAVPYFLAKRYRNDPGESARENRMMVEIGNGFSGGSNVASALIVLSQLVGVV